MMRGEGRVKPSGAVSSRHTVDTEQASMQHYYTFLFDKRETETIFCLF